MMPIIHLTQLVHSIGTFNWYIQLVHSIGTFNRYTLIPCLFYIFYILNELLMSFDSSFCYVLNHGAAAQ